MEEVRHILKEKDWDVKQLAGSDVGKLPLLDRLNQTAPDLLHIATHGYTIPVDQVDPLADSGLVMVGANYYLQSENKCTSFDDLLSAYEQSNLYLPSFSLVVLSACQAGLGVSYACEGIYGLPRAFKKAGAGNILYSIWLIKDMEILIFMRLFYNALTIEHPRAAYDETIKKLRTCYPDPEIWASFVLME